MPRTKRVPTYTLHKPSGQARVILDGKHRYLGPYGSEESRQAYARLIAEHLVHGDLSPNSASRPEPSADLSINELLVKYLQFATRYYVKNGRLTGELHNIKDALRPLRALYSHSRACVFGPLALKAVRQHMIDHEDLCRGVINSRINRIRRLFKWAVSEELVPPAVLQSLQAVAGLRAGRSGARESQPVRPVTDEAVLATLRFLPPQVADMVMLQRLTSMRPGSVVIMRGCDIERSGDVWIYEPAEHKTSSWGRRLQIALGPKARTIVSRYLNRPPQDYLFSPQEAADWRREQPKHKSRPRHTPVYPSELQRRQRQKAARARRKRRRPLRARYDTASYRRTIKYAIEAAARAGVRIPDWHPHQLRHTKASEVRAAYGLEGAQVIMGHARADVTQVYAERNLRLALEIARQTG